MSKKLSMIGSAFVIVLVGFFFYQQYIGKPNVILAYIDETDYMVEQFNTLYDGEAKAIDESDGELTKYTEEVLIPGLKEILAASTAYSEKIENNELKEVHNLHTEAISYYLKAEEAWVAGESFDEFFVKGDELYELYEAEFGRLAEKMNVELEWE